MWGPFTSTFCEHCFTESCRADVKEASLHLDKSNISKYIRYIEIYENRFLIYLPSTFHKSGKTVFVCAYVVRDSQIRLSCNFEQQIIETFLPTLGRIKSPGITLPLSHSPRTGSIKKIYRKGRYRSKYIYIIVQATGYLL